jgi:CheY-like chemotaxis protein
VPVDLDSGTLNMSLSPARTSAALSPDAAATAASPAGRSQLELLKAQVHAIDAWNRAHRPSHDTVEVIGLTREMRLDLRQRMEARRREQAALVARVDEQLRTSGDLLTSRRPVRVVLAHRSEWLCETIGSRLTERGLVVVGVFRDGAEAAGTIVAEQPDLVFVQDRLPSLAGSDLVRRVREFSPLSVIGAQVQDGRGIAPLLDVGAHAVFTHRTPPSETADQLLVCLGRQQLTLAG